MQAKMTDEQELYYWLTVCDLTSKLNLKMIMLPSLPLSKMLKLLWPLIAFILLVALQATTKLELLLAPG